MKQEKKEYMAPALTVVTFRTEKGYAASGLALSQWIAASIDPPTQEQWIEDNTYSGSSWQ
jgi:hypothetical protein